MWEQKKNTSAQKHIYHKHITLQQGETYPNLASSHLVRRHLLRRWSQTRLTSLAEQSGRGSWSGEGSNVCNRVGSKRVSLQRSSQGSYPAWPWPRLAGTGEPEKIRLICLVFGANSCIPSQLFSLSILVPERIYFHLQSRELHRDGIHIPVNSLSLNADRFSHSFNQNGQPCETLWNYICVNKNERNFIQTNVTFPETIKNMPLQKKKNTMKT